MRFIDIRSLLIFTAVSCFFFAVWSYLKGESEGLSNVFRAVALVASVSFPLQLFLRMAGLQFAWRLTIGTLGPAALSTVRYWHNAALDADGQYFVTPIPLAIVFFEALVFFLIACLLSDTAQSHVLARRGQQHEPKK